LNFVATEELNCVIELIDIPPTTTSPKEPVDVEEPLMLPLAVTWFIWASLPETITFFQLGI
jgi:hypothetical protein